MQHFAPGRRARAARPACARSASRAWLVAVVALALVTAGCTTVLVRSPVPRGDFSDLSRVAPYGISGEVVRFWGDTLSAADVSAILSQNISRIGENRADAIDPDAPLRIDWLVLSGGGPDGAYGAGLLAGWHARGDRPDFKLVTGVSTGAIVALFAFLGPQYDDTLRTLYTAYTTKDLATRTILAGLTGGTALLDTSGYRRLIDSYVDDKMVAELAAKHRNGYTLLIGTTNLDVSRPVIWNIGAIAASGHPAAKQLIRDVVQASSAIPAAFPPVLVPVKVDGRSYDEMHVDGGATQQLMLFSPQIPLRRLDQALGRNLDRTIYIIINNKLRKPYDPVPPRLYSIAATAISSLISGSGSGDIYKIYAIAERDGLELRVTWIPPEFDREAEEMFDPNYMKALYDLGFEAGRGGVRWETSPPDFTSSE
jgi:predicted acylesterase/phospholipase RssA